jgi:hypothetical protein
MILGSRQPISSHLFGRAGRGRPGPADVDPSPAGGIAYVARKLSDIASRTAVRAADADNSSNMALKSRTTETVKPYSPSPRPMISFMISLVPPKNDISDMLAAVRSRN